MEELCARLGSPERRFRVVHVVGTNGKSSVAELCRRLLAGAGLRAGAYLSPHLDSWTERVRLPSGDGERFAAAVEAAAAQAEAISAERGKDWQPTQFEVATAAALLALAEDGAEVAAIEAGLGGRLDATNVCEGEVVVLTTVALDHTQWLGETIAEIAAEKLGVAGPGSTLVIGSVPDEVIAQARAVVDAAGGTLIAGIRAPAGGGFQAENAAVARGAVEALLGRDAEPDRDLPASTALAEGPPLPARGELIEGDPPVMLDLAHNPAAARALAASPELAERRVVGCVALLDDKDLAGFAAALAPALGELIATETGPLPGSARPGARPHGAAAVAGAFEAVGVEKVIALADPREAVEAALSRARRSGAIALITGSHYLLRLTWIPGRDHSYSR